MVVNILGFVLSDWGLGVNVLLILLVSAFAYDKFAKRWGITTGRFETIGRITWSEYYGLGGSNSFGSTLISYTYTVNGKAYNGELAGKSITQKMVEDNPRGKEVSIFFAPRDPKYSCFECPPRALYLGSQLIASHVLFPVLLVNIIMTFVFQLFID